MNGGFDRLRRVIRVSIRVVAMLLLCLCLVGATTDSPPTVAIIVVGGGLLALLGQGWALQRGIDQKLTDRIDLHERGCPVHERLARMETKLDYIERVVNKLSGDG